MPVQTAVRVRAQVGVPLPAQYPPRPHRTHPPQEDRRMGRQPAWIKIKCNSLVNEKCVNALHRASQADARIDCVVRDSAASIPVSPPLAIPSASTRSRAVSSNIRASTLAPARRAAIGEGPKSVPEVRIGPTDLMHRNLDHRVEGSCTSPTRTRSSGFSTTSTCRCMTRPASGTSSPTAPASTTTTREAAVSTTANTSPLSARLHDRRA